MYGLYGGVDECVQFLDKKNPTISGGIVVVGGQRLGRSAYCLPSAAFVFTSKFFNNWWVNHQVLPYFHLEGCELAAAGDMVLAY